MYREIYNFFGYVPIHGYGLAIVVGFLLAIWVASREARRRGLPPVMYDFGMVMLLSGIFGGRLFYYLQFYDEQFAGQSILEFLKIWKGGLVFYGGAIGGFVGGIIYLGWKKLPWPDVLDVASIGVPIGMAFGRIGCFLNGCCFGRRCSPDFPLGVEFPVGEGESPAYDHHLREGWLEAGDAAIPVHPVQLYQGTHDIALFFLLWWYVGSGRAPRGAGMPALWFLYAIGRFFIEALRGDHTVTFTGLTTSQNVSIPAAVVFGGLLVFAYWRAYRLRNGGLEKSGIAC